MKVVFLTLVAAAVFGATAIAALADQPDRAAFVPVVEQSEAKANHVRRATQSKTGFRKVQLTRAEPAQVDLNKDGKVSFKELLAYDF